MYSALHQKNETNEKNNNDKYIIINCQIPGNRQQKYMVCPNSTGGKHD